MSPDEKQGNGVYSILLSVPHLRASKWGTLNSAGNPQFMQNGGYSQNGAGQGLRGTFVHRCMLDIWLVAFGRKKLTIGELLFAPFASIRLG